jgi:hypothetical protein
MLIQQWTQQEAAGEILKRLVSAKKERTRFE